MDVLCFDSFNYLLKVSYVSLKCENWCSDSSSMLLLCCFHSFKCQILTYIYLLTMAVFANTTVLHYCCVSCLVKTWIIFVNLLRSYCILSKNSRHYKCMSDMMIPFFPHCLALLLGGRGTWLVGDSKIHCLVLHYLWHRHLPLAVLHSSRCASYMYLL